MHADKEARPNAEQIGKDREPAKRTSAESLGWSAAEPQEQGRREHSHPAERTTAYSSHLTFCNRNRGGPFGVRRQSEAATALYIKILNQKRCSTTLATALHILPPASRAPLLLVV